MIIYLEGNIGSGKSTFMSLISENIHNCMFIQEPVNEWVEIKDSKGVNILDKFYNDTKKWAFPFQMTTFITRVQKIATIPNNRLALVERSVFTDKKCFARSLFESGHLNEIEWKLYNDWFVWLCDNFNVKPSAYIYLKTEPETCFERIKKRSRNEETTISLDYLSKLHDKHEQWMSYERKYMPVLTIDVRKDFEHTPERLNEIIKQVQTFIKKLI